jgi:hypothetical protein
MPSLRSFIGAYLHRNLSFEPSCSVQASTPDRQTVGNRRTHSQVKITARHHPGRIGCSHWNSQNVPIARGAWSSRPFSPRSDPNCRCPRRRQDSPARAQPLVLVGPYPRMCRFRHTPTGPSHFLLLNPGDDQRTDRNNDLSKIVVSLWRNHPLEGYGMGIRYFDNGRGDRRAFGPSENPALTASAIARF